MLQKNILLKAPLELRYFMNMVMMIMVLIIVNNSVSEIGLPDDIIVFILILHFN